MSQTLSSSVETIDATAQSIPREQDKKNLLTLKEAEEEVKISNYTLRDWVRKNKLPSYKIDTARGLTIFLHRTELHAYVKERRKGIYDKKYVAPREGGLQDEEDYQGDKNVLQDSLELLRSQLEAKDKQIEFKDGQNTRLLDRNEQLEKELSQLHSKYEETIKLMGERLMPLLEEQQERLQKQEQLLLNNHQEQVSQSSKYTEVVERMERDQSERLEAIAKKVDATQNKKGFFAGLFG